MLRAFINRQLGKFGYQLSRAHGIAATYRLLRHHEYFADKLRRVASIEGDIVECGVGVGHSLMLLLTLAYEEGKGRIVWGLDSFQGYPEPSEEDASELRNPKKGQWNNITPETLNDILFRRCQLPAPARGQLQIVPGFFADTLPKFEARNIALLHLDVDLYQSYKDCLTHLYSKVQPGGVILFDEYRQGNVSEVFPGAAKAIDEFFADKPEKPMRDARFDKFFTVKA